MAVLPFLSFLIPVPPLAWLDRPPKHPPGRQARGLDGFGHRPLAVARVLGVLHLVNSPQLAPR